MTNVRSKSSATAIIMILMMATSAALLSIPSVHAPTSLNTTISWNQFTGMGSETRLIINVNPNVFATDPDLVGKTSIWATANLTLTAPDGTKTVVNGPFTLKPDVIGGEGARLYIPYTFNQAGFWNLTFTYPGDAKYNPINASAPGTAGPSPLLVLPYAIPKRACWAMLSISPYPNVGLGQDILINAWITPPPYTDRQNFEGYVFTFTRPDGTSFTVGPMDSEGPATVWFNLPLDTVGNWSIKFDFPGDYGTLPATITRHINVVSDPIPRYPDTPLPIDRPLTRPINIQNRAWRTIAGPWQQDSYNASEGSFNPYTEAPRTAHILWRLPAYSGIGGFSGSPLGIRTSQGDEAYGQEPQGVMSSSVYSCDGIIAGRWYSTSGGNITCFDLRTSKILWVRPGEGFDYATYRGRLACLYDFGSSRFIAYNAIDGTIVNNVTGVSVNFYAAPYAYSFQNTTIGTGRLIKWDASSTTTNFTARIVWNQTNILPYSSSAHCLIQGNCMISRHFLTSGNQLYNPDYTVNTIIVDYITATNLTTGLQEWNVTTMNPADPNVYIYRQGPAWGSGLGLVYFAGFGNINNGLGYVAFNAKDGSLAWWSKPTDYPWGNFWAYQPQASAYGLVIGLGYSGIWGFNATNGDIVWHYINNDTYYEEPYASNIVGSGYSNNLNLSVGDSYASYSYGSTGPIVGGNTAESAVIYAVQSEHSATFYYRGYGMQAIDLDTGAHLFDIKGTYQLGGLAEGVLIMQDSNNGYTTAWAKGETETTVSTSDEVIAKGESVLLKGNVLDMSPAQPGTAAVSDGTVEDWMEYLHMQQPYPVSGRGVAVSLDTLDPNNNYVHIGDTTTDLTGAYSLGFTPEIEGKYTIIASFYNTEAYYGSSAETAMLVTKAPETTTPSGNTGTQASPDYTMAILGVGIAVIIVVAIVGAILALMLRRRA